MAASSTAARLFLLRNLNFVKGPQILQSLINPTMHKLYFQRPVFSLDLERVEAARGRKPVDSDEEHTRSGKIHPLRERFRRLDDNDDDEHASDDEFYIGRRRFKPSDSDCDSYTDSDQDQYNNSR